MQEAQPHWNPSSPSGQVSNISIILWGFLIAAIQHLLLNSSQALQRVMYTIRDTCWRVEPGQFTVGSIISTGEEFGTYNKRADEVLVVDA